MGRWPLAEGRVDCRATGPQGGRATPLMNIYSALRTSCVSSAGGSDHFSAVKKKEENAPFNIADISETYI